MFKSGTITGVALVGLMLPGWVSATCYSNQSADTPADLSGYLSGVVLGGEAYIDFGEVAISPAAPIGSTVASVTYGLIGQASATDYLTVCDTATEITSMTGTFSMNSSDFTAKTLNGEYLLDIGQGLGLRVANIGTDPAGRYWAFPPSYYYYIADLNNSIGDYSGVAMARFGSWRFDLVRVSDTVESGPSSSGQIVRFTTQNSSAAALGLTSAFIYYFHLSPFTLTTPTCTINSYDTNVDFGKVNRRGQTSAGSVFNDTDFTINITCASTVLSPTLTFSGEVDGNVSTVFANNGNATGVGVQLLYGSSVIEPDVAVSLGNAASTAATDYEFTARVYQTTGTVSPGSINSSVVFTLDYE